MSSGDSMRVSCSGWGLVVSFALAALLATAGCDGPHLDPRVTSGPVVHLDPAPPPISGGSLLVTRDGTRAIAADPDRDRVVVVDLTQDAVESETALPARSEPGRVVEDAHGRIHVALRGSGEVFSFDPAAPEAGERRAACSMPRGLAYEPREDAVLVACRGGELVVLPAGGGDALRTLHVTPDLRDVLVLDDGRAFVTTFRGAALAQVDLATGSVRSWSVPETVTLAQGRTNDTFEADVAWRAIVLPGTHTIAMVHQRARSDSVLVATAPPDFPPYAVPRGSASSTSATLCRSSVVHSSVTLFDVDTGAIEGGAALHDATLPVDVASAGGEIAVVAAGNQDGTHAVLTISYPDSHLSLAERGGCALADAHDARRPIAVAYDADGARVVLERDPAALLHGDARIALGGADVFDTGHAIFHGNPGSTDACASCHPEGGEDGRVWIFDGVGRRTMPMPPSIAATAPLHWSGDETDLGALMDDVFVSRMGGPTLADDRVGALGGWIDGLPAPRASASVDPDAVARGRALFEGQAGCATCHAGALFTNDATMDVGTGGAFQVPSLVGVSHRLPLMHDGCARTLEERFTPSCGGARHGATADLSSSRIDDLIAYLETL